MADRFAWLLRPHIVVMLALFVGAAWAGTLILPGESERVAMLERDGKNRRALELLEGRGQDRSQSQRATYQREQLYAHFGNLAKARLMIEKLAAERPADHVLQMRLARFYRQTQDREAYLATLSRLVSRRYSEAICGELIAQLRLVGQYVREREAIERCRLKGYRRVEDLVRLAELEWADGDQAKAALLLRKLDDAGRLAAVQGRMLLASYLIDGKAAQEAERRSIAWMRASRSDMEFALGFIEFLARRGAYDIGISIAREAGEPGDAISLSVADLLLERDESEAARAYLRGWLEQARLDTAKTGHGEEVTSRFIGLALDAEAPQLALDGAQRYGLKRLPERQLVALAEALGAEGRRTEFELIRSALASDVLISHPLLAAMVELNRGESTASQQLVASVPFDELERWRLALWARLMRETGRADIADRKLGALGQAVAAAPQRYVARTARTARIVERRRAASATQAGAAAVGISTSSIEASAQPPRRRTFSRLKRTTKFSRLRNADRKRRRVVVSRAALPRPSPAVAPAPSALAPW
ncbi:MAG: tetratricopeptide repeat protein [Hyphomicrobiaceae bacterium]